MNTTSEIVKLATGLAAPYSVELDAGSSYTLQVLPREFLTLIRNKVLEIGTESSKIKSTKLVLTGPAGAGKSLLLYLCALDCHNTKNWLVWYIPSTKEYDDYTDNEMAGNLLGSLLRANIDVFTKYSTCENVNRIKKLAEKRDNKPSALREIVTMLLMKSEIPVFIGIDQWVIIQINSRIVSKNKSCSRSCLVT